LVHVRVPATSANLGPGFDALGLALALYNEVEARESDGVVVWTLELQTEREATAAGRQIDALQKQLSVIQALDRGDFDSLRELGFRVEAAPTDGAAAAVNGEAPASEESAAPAPPAAG